MPKQLATNEGYKNKQTRIEIPGTIYFTTSTRLYALFACFTQSLQPFV